MGLIKDMKAIYQVFKGVCMFSFIGSGIVTQIFLLQTYWINGSWKAFTLSTTGLFGLIYLFNILYNLMKISKKVKK